MKLTNFFDKSIRFKLLTITGITVFFLLVIGLIFNSNLNNEKKAREAIVQNGLASYYFVMADMMHDALRADLFNAMLVRGSKNGEIAEIKNEFHEHANLFKEELQLISKLDVEESVKNLVKEADGPLNNYISYTEEFINWLDKVDSSNVNELESKKAEFTEIFNTLAEKNEKLSEKILAESERVKEESIISSSNSLKINIVVILISILLITFLSLKISNGISDSITKTQKMVEKMSNGDLPEAEVKQNADEVGDMVDRMNTLSDNLKNVKYFANQVGEGNFDTEVSVFNNSGELGIALSGMRDSLKQVAIEDKNRAWITTGVAQISDILRQNTDDITIFYDNIIKFVVKYLNANQGGLFLLNDDNSRDIHIEMVACYAYDRKKFLERRMDLNEGLVGQCYLEKDMIYLTDVPNEYVSIKSGLGEATPRCLILVPLMVNEEINGVLEIASFEVFETYKIEFLKRLSESIASSISTTKTNAKTNKLLQQTQQQTEELKAQEEEMRQNLEELQATQEEINRKENSYIIKIAQLESKIEELSR